MATQRESLVVSALRALFERVFEFINENNDDGGSKIALSHGQRCILHVYRSQNLI